MKHGLYTILEQRKLTRDVCLMKLEGDTSSLTSPGQFLEIRLDGFFLRRPISVCDYDASTITIIYKIVGQGTDAMCRLAAGTRLDVLCGLGNGFDISVAGDSPLLVGGGVGVPPLYSLARKLLENGKVPYVLLGFNKSGEVFFAQEFKALGAEVTVTTVDGSMGRKGFVTDALPAAYSHVYACGPMPMLRALYRATGNIKGQFSLEERMGCGFGACMGCSIMTRSGSRRVCKEGPVFAKEELEW